MLLIATMAIPISAINKEYEIEPEPVLKDADVPVWTVGDSWTYEMLYHESGDKNESFYYDVIGEITYEVIDDSGDIYKLKGTGANFSLSLTVGNLKFKPTRFFKAGTELEIRKSDLALVFWHQFTKGLYLPYIGKLPLPIPIQLEAFKKTTFSPPWSIMPFPLYDGKNGTLNSVDFEEEFRSQMYWGLIKLSDGNNTWGFSGLDYTCNEEQVTVPAGTYTAYNVSAEYPDWDWFRSFYCEEVGNSVKQLIHIDYGGSEHVTYYHMELDLISTTYTP